MRNRYRLAGIARAAATAVIAPAIATPASAQFGGEHRDARRALGTFADGRVIVARTRFDALGEALGRVPFGLSAPCRCLARPPAFRLRG